MRFSGRDDLNPRNLHAWTKLSNLFGSGRNKRENETDDGNLNAATTKWFLKNIDFKFDEENARVGTPRLLRNFLDTETTIIKNNYIITLHLWIMFSF